MQRDPTRATTTGVAVATRSSESRPDGQRPEDEGIFAALRRRLINFKTMSWPLRIVTALGFAQLVLVGVLTVLRDKLAAQALTPTNATGLPLAIPQVIFFALLGSFVLAWTCALTGALHSQWLVRLLSLWVFTTLVVSVQRPGVLGEIQAGLLLVLWLWGGVLWLIEARSGADRTLLRNGRLVASTFALVLALLTGYYALLYAQNPATLADTVTGQLLLLLILLVPVLFLAGTDLAEMGETVSHQVARLLSRVRLFALLPLITVLVASGVAVYALMHLIPGLDIAAPTFEVVPTLLLLLSLGVVALAVLAGMAALGRVSRWSPGQGVPLTVLLAALVPVVLMAVASSFLPSPGEGFQIYRHEAHQPYFSLAYPANWTVYSEQDNAALGATNVFLTGGQDSILPGAFLVYRVHVPGIGSSPPSPSDIDGFLQGDNQGNLGVLRQTFATQSNSPQQVTIQLNAAGRQDAWYVRAFTASYATTGTTFEGSAWVQVIGDDAYFLIGATPNGNFAAIQTASARMVASFRSDLSAAIPSDGPAVGPASGTTGLVIVLGLLPLALGVAVGLPLLLAGRRRQGFGLAGLFFLIIGLEGAYAIGVDLLARDSALEGDPHLALHTFLLFIAFATVLVALLLAVLPSGRRLVAGGGAGRLLTVLLALNVGLLIIDWATAAFGGVTVSIERFTLAQVGLLVLASCWDLATSGARVTNVEGRVVPRAGRLLLYLGYTMIISTFVLFLASLYASSTSPATLSNTVSLLSTGGLYFLGVPLLVTSTVVGIANMGATNHPFAVPAAASVAPRQHIWALAQRYAVTAAALFVAPVLIVSLVITFSPSVVSTYQAGLSAYDACRSSASGNCVHPALPTIAVVFLILLGVAFLAVLVMAAVAGRTVAWASGLKRTGLFAAILVGGFATVALAAANTIATAAGMGPFPVLISFNYPPLASSSQAYDYRFGLGVGAGLFSLLLLVAVVPLSALAGLLGSFRVGRKALPTLPAAGAAPLAS